MHNSRCHIIKLLCMILPLTLLFSCSGDDAPGNGRHGGGASPGQPVSLRITTGSGTASRAIPQTDKYETGGIDENHIDIGNGDFRILFFDSGNKFISEFEPDDINIIPAATDERIYNMLGTLAAPLPPDFKVVVLANWGRDNYPETIPGETTIGTVCGQTYDYVWDFKPSAVTGQSKGIPMYGIKTCTGVTFSPDLLSDLGTIDLLRAMAKVEILCEDATILINSAILNCVNPQGYCAPSDMHDNTGYAGRVHIPAGITAEEKSRSYSEGADKVVFYIPEYENPDNSATVKLSFRLPDDETKEGTIYFKDYTKAADSPFDIARNHIYRFTVRFNTSLEIDYTVCPWQKYLVNDIPPFE